MEPVVLFRKGLESEDEFLVCKKHFGTFEYRSEIPSNSIVIGRYSVLPFYEELDKELKLKGSSLINSYRQHRYIADIMNYYEDLKDYTPKTYTRWEALGDGKYVVKGRTNSIKQRWNTHMFADGKENLIQVIKNIYDNLMISEQGLVVRDFVPLIKLDEGINGVPISKEWRCFCYKDKILATGFYWCSFPDISPGNLSQEGIDFVQKIANIVSKKTNFYVVDVGEKESGGYIVIELNDACMAGLSDVDPNELYENLKNNFKE